MKIRKTSIQPYLAEEDIQLFITIQQDLCHATNKDKLVMVFTKTIPDGRGMRRSPDIFFFPHNEVTRIKFPK